MNKPNTPTPLCEHTGRPLVQCPRVEQSAAPNEYEPSMECVTMQCPDCGRVSFGMRESKGNENND